MKEKLTVVLLAIGIFLLAAFFRLYGVNWDADQHLHPDERFLTMVANGISWPRSAGEYLDTSTSPLNPHNRGFGFFVYGTFPVFFTKWVAEGLKKGDYSGLTLVGRQLSALFDLGTVILVFLIARETIAESVKRKAESKTREDKLLHASRFTLHAFPLLSMFFYSIMVLPIQLSHFYAVDTYLTFFTTLSFYLLTLLMRFDLQRGRTSTGIITVILSIAFGLAVASKISALLLLPIIGLGFLAWLIKNRNLSLFIVFCLLFFVSSYFTIRFAQPYAFANGNLFDISVNQKFIQNMKELKSMDNEKAMFPPAVQWRDTPSYIFPLKSIFLTGLGLPLGFISSLAVILSLFHIVKTVSFAIKKAGPFRWFYAIHLKDIILGLILIFIFTVFIYQGGLYTKNLRYFVAMYPFLAILAGYFINLCFQKLIPVIKSPLSSAMILIGILVTTLIWPVAFFAIYQRPHSRVTASYWIYQNIPSGSTLSYEHWDDPLPLHLPTLTPERYKYKFVEMPLYEPDVASKWEKVAKNLTEADYLIMSSNRLWGSIPRVPSMYPITQEYYQALFDGRLGFTKVADITSTPCFPTAKLCLFPIDDSVFAEESFTVYDHPQVLIYKKVQLNIDLLNQWLAQSKAMKN